MIYLFEALDVFLEEKLLLLQIRGLDYIPNKHEEFCINGHSYRVLHVKHDFRVVGSMPNHNLEIYLGKEDLYKTYTFGTEIYEEQEGGFDGEAE
jgi:hypothetical protein